MGGEEGGGNGSATLVKRLKVESAVVEVYQKKNNTKLV